MRESFTFHLFDWETFAVILFSIESAAMAESIPWKIYQKSVKPQNFPLA